MEFMLLFLGRPGDPREPAGMAEMKKYAAELASQGKLRRGAPLALESDAAQVRVEGGKALVTDGPFAESKEVLGGFCIVEARDRDEAIEIARRAPHARYGTVEVHAASLRMGFADSGKGSPYLHVFRMEPGLSDPDGSKMAEMIAHGDELVRDGKLLETAPLAKDPAPARIEPRGGKTLVIDGPFAESREVVGGYNIVRAASRAEAIEIAVSTPHAKWGPVEVREILFFDPV